MPAFIFVSGLFSKRTVNERNYRKMSSFLILYLVTKAYLFLCKLIVKPTAGMKLFEEDGLPWYAFIIFVCYLAASCVKNCNKLYIMIGSILLGCFVGYDKSIGDYLMISRIFVFFPFFWAGYCLEHKEIEKYIAGTWKRILAVGVLLGSLVVCFWKTEWLYQFRPFLSGRNSFAIILKDQSVWGGALRFSFYIIAFLLTAAVIIAMPSVKRWYSAMGSKTLQVYAFHNGIIYLLFYKFDINQILLKLYPAHYKILYVPLTILVFIICLIPALGWFLNRVMDPYQGTEKQQILHNK